IGQIRGGLITRPDSFLGFITTQSDEVPAGAFKAELNLARAIRDGRVSGLAARMLPLLYEFPEEMQTERDAWESSAHWYMVNPNLGHSVSLDRLEADWAQAKEKGEVEMRRWASQHLNVQIGLALHDQRWRGADYWEGAADAEACGTLEALLVRCEVVVAAADGGGLDDLFGFAVAGREKGSDRWLFWAHAWALTNVLEVRKEIAPALLDFAADGDLTVVERASEIVAGVTAMGQQLIDSGLLPDKAGFGVDPYGIGAVTDALDGIGIVEPCLWPLGQGTRLSSAIWSMEFKLSDGMLAHSGSRLMAWCVGNAKAEQRGDAVLITKETAGKSKIDPLVAMFMATKLLEANPEAGQGGPSVYETRGALVL
ncbi:MAG: terminase large subunit, partial [Pseudomonadota bacterium]